MCSRHVCTYDDKLKIVNVLQCVPIWIYIGNRLWMRVVDSGRMQGQLNSLNNSILQKTHCKTTGSYSNTWKIQKHVTCAYCPLSTKNHVTLIENTITEKHAKTISMQHNKSIQKNKFNVTRHSTSVVSHRKYRYGKTRK